MSHVDDLKNWFWETMLYHLKWDHKQDLAHVTGKLLANTVPTRALVPGAVTPDRLSFDPATQAELDAEAAARAAADTAHAAVIASATVLGHVKVGSGLAIDGSGVLSATGSSSETFGVAFTSSGDVALLADGRIATKRY